MHVSRPSFRLSCCDQTLDLGHKTLIMGILNVTPDSFSDGGLYDNADKAIDHALALCEAGADIIDIGGESSRPAGPYGQGAQKVSLNEELERTIPVIEAIAPKINVPISIDTTKATVAHEAIRAGARIINDISALRFDTAMARTASDTGAAVILMHMQGTPATMQDAPQYDNVIADITAFLLDQADRAKAAGINQDQIVIDPGLGFGKTYDHNIEILRHLDHFHSLGYPLLAGPSRKQFTGPQTTSQERIPGTIAALAFCVSAGTHIVRVHDVAQASQALALADAICNHNRAETP